MKHKSNEELNNIEKIQEQAHKEQYVNILESILTKNSLYFLVFDKNGRIMFQNLPNAKKIQSLEDHLLYPQ